MLYRPPRRLIAEVFRGVESAVEILEYVLDIEEVRVLGDHAFQWGTYRHTMRPRGGGETVLSVGKLMRILQRQRDGSWKIHRGIATVDPPAVIPSVGLATAESEGPASRMRNKS